MGKIKQKRWFHATTKENWEKIKKEGVLWGIGIGGRYTFLASNLKHLLWLMSHKFPANSDMQNFEVILSVKYTPINERLENGWELIVKNPIPLENVRVLKYI